VSLPANVVGGVGWDGKDEEVGIEWVGVEGVLEGAEYYITFSIIFMMLS